jgi:hypothetical protein
MHDKFTFTKSTTCKTILNSSQQLSKIIGGFGGVGGGGGHTLIKTFIQSIPSTHMIITIIK